MSFLTVIPFTEEEYIIIINQYIINYKAAYTNTLAAESQEKFGLFSSIIHLFFLCPLVYDVSKVEVFWNLKIFCSPNYFVSHQTTSFCVYSGSTVLMINRIILFMELSSVSITEYTQRTSVFTLNARLTRY